jgi:hypothetical protein
MNPFIEYRIKTFQNRANARPLAGKLHSPHSRLGANTPIDLIKSQLLLSSHAQASATQKIHGGHPWVRLYFCYEHEVRSPSANVE